MSAARDEILIIGAGVVGLSCALHLLREGRAVRVLDRDAPGAGSSHGNCGTLTPSHAAPLAAPGTVAKALRWMLQPDAPFYVRPRWDPALWAWLLRFARRCNPRDFELTLQRKGALLLAARREIEALVRDEALDCGFESSGLVHVHRSAESFDEDAREAEQLRAFGIEAEVWSPARLAREEPGLKAGVSGGVFFPGDAQLQPQQYVEALAQRVRALGGQIDTGCGVERLQHGPDGWTLATTRGPRTAAQVVLAAGAWSPGLARDLGLHLPVQPGKGYSITYTRPSEPPRRALVLAERSVCVTTWPGGFRLGSTMEFSGYDTRLNTVRLEALKRAAAEYLREPAGPQVLEHWYGWRPMTWDDLPLVGAVAGRPGLWLATGHGMLGVTLSATTGRGIADLITGRDPGPEIRACDPMRMVTAA